jgi:hypothetical protein
MTALIALLADANSRTAAAPDEGIALPIIIGILVVVLLGGWMLWRIFSGRTRTAVADNLEDTPDRDRFKRGGEPAVGVPTGNAADRVPESDRSA